MSRKISSLVLSLALSFSLFYFSLPVLAYDIEPVQIDESRRDFVVGPGKVDLMLQPGESKVIEVMVSNRTGLDREFEIKFQDFVGSRDVNSTVVFTDEKGANTLKDYISVSEKVFFLKNGQRARIPVTVSLPFGSEPGGRYAMILVSTLTPLDKSSDDAGVKSGVPVITQTGTLLFVTVPGEIKREGSLADFTTRAKKWIFSTANNVFFEIVFDNTGLIHLRPSGIISVKNILGQEVRRLEIDPWFAMPQALRLREVGLTTDGGSLFMLGRYTAEAKIFRDYDNLYDTKTLAFWVIPWKILLIIFLVLVVLITLITLVFRYLSKHLEFKSNQEIKAKEQAKEIPTPQANDNTNQAS